jgi:hypothetical protein
MWIFAICGKCFVFASSYLYAIYAVIVGILSFLRLDGTSGTSGAGTVSSSRLPPIPGELSLFQLKISVSAQIVTRFIVHAFSFEAFQRVVRATVKLIRIVFLMNDNPSLVRSYLRYLNVYLIIVPAPAALFWPVLHHQRQLDFQLALAAVLMILINAAGDVASVRLFLWNFEGLRFAHIEHNASEKSRFWVNARNEALYFLQVAKGAGYSLAVLLVVLALCSVLFGVQIGQFDIDFSWRFFRGAADRIVHFYDLAFEPYWLTGHAAPFATKGFPGLFLYGVITFIPMVVLFALTAIWMLLLPIRLALTVPGGLVYRVISSELALLLLCIVVTHFIDLDFWRFYNFLMHS